MSASRPVCSICAAASRRSLGVAIEDPPRAARLDHHHADRVGHDVVHLAREPTALVGNDGATWASRSSSARTAARAGLGEPRAVPHGAPASQQQSVSPPGNR